MCDVVSSDCVAKRNASALAKSKKNPDDFDDDFGPVTCDRCFLLFLNSNKHSHSRSVFLSEPFKLLVQTFLMLWNACKYNIVKREATFKAASCLEMLLPCRLNQMTRIIGSST